MYSSNTVMDVSEASPTTNLGMVCLCQNAIYSLNWLLCMSCFRRSRVLPDFVAAAVSLQSSNVGECSRPRKTLAFRRRMWASLALHLFSHSSFHWQHSFPCVLRHHLQIRDRPGFWESHRHLSQLVRDRRSAGGIDLSRFVWTLKFPELEHLPSTSAHCSAGQVASPIWSLPGALLDSLADLRSCLVVSRIGLGLVLYGRKQSPYSQKLAQGRGDACPFLSWILALSCISLRPQNQ